jgi:hypothetical protein
MPQPSTAQAGPAIVSGKQHSQRMNAQEQVMATMGLRNTLCSLRGPYNPPSRKKLSALPSRHAGENNLIAPEMK